MFVYVKWNSSLCGSLADGSVIRAWFVFAGHSRNEGPRRRGRSVWDGVQGVAPEEDFECQESWAAGLFLRMA